MQVLCAMGASAEHRGRKKGMTLCRAIRMVVGVDGSGVARVSPLCRRDSMGCCPWLCLGMCARPRALFFRSVPPCSPTPSTSAAS